MAKNEVDTLDESDDAPAYVTSPELREYSGEEGAVVETDELNSLDDVHAVAAYNRAVMGPAATDPTIPTPGTDVDVEPGPGPEDNEELDNATGGAMSNAAETGILPPTEPFTGRRQDAPPTGVAGITGTEAIGGGGGDDDEDGEYDPGDYTVAEVLDYIAAHPEQEEAILDAEAAGKGRAGIVG